MSLPRAEGTRYSLCAAILEWSREATFIGYIASQSLTRQVPFCHYTEILCTDTHEIPVLRILYNYNEIYDEKYNGNVFY